MWKVMANVYDLILQISTNFLIVCNLTTIANIWNCDECWTAEIMITERTFITNFFWNIVRISAHHLLDKFSLYSAININVGPWIKEIGKNKNKLKVPPPIWNSIVIFLKDENRKEFLQLFPTTHGRRFILDVRNIFYCKMFSSDATYLTVAQLNSKKWIQWYQLK